MVTQKSQVAQVQIGNLVIDGYLMPSGEFAMSQSQVFSWVDPTTEAGQRAKRYIEITKSKVAKTLVSQGFLVHRKISVLQVKEKVNLVPLNQVAPFLTVCLAMGYPHCAEILALLSGLALHQLFCDAFNIKFEQEQRQEWLTIRQSVKETFRKSLTDALKAYGYTEHWQYAKFISALQASCGFENGMRDDLDFRELAHLNACQSIVGSLIDVGMEPYKALKVWISRN